MKTRLFAIGLIIIFPVAGAILSGCASPSGESFTLETPGCTATWNDDITWVAWSKVDGADYYVIYGKKYNKNADPPESPPHNPKDFTLIEKKVPINPNNRVTKDDYSYPHNTRDDYSYAVKAFKNNGESSDFSNVAFTW
jgi:hypothetical protein